jgi:hypothetical protein
MEEGHPGQMVLERGRKGRGRKESREGEKDGGREKPSSSDVLYRNQHKIDHKLKCKDCKAIKLLGKKPHKNIFRA